MAEELGLVRSLTFTSSELHRAESIITTAGGNVIEQDDNHCFVSSVLFTMGSPETFLLMCKDVSMMGGTTIKVKAFTTEECREEQPDLEGFDVDICISRLDELPAALKSLKIYKHLALVQSLTFTSSELHRAESIITTAGGIVIEQDDNHIFVSSVLFTMGSPETFLLMCKDVSMMGGTTIKVKAFTTEECREEQPDLEGFDVNICISRLDELPAALKSLKI